MKTTERTIERPRVERVVSSSATRPSAIAVVAAALALVIGLGVGFLLWGSDDPSATDMVAVDGVELSDRQQQMGDFLDDYVVAWREGDGEAIAAMVTDKASLNVFGTEYATEGGAFAEYIDRHPTPSLETLEPLLVDEDTVLMFHHIAGYGTLSDVIEFTSTGEVLIVSHQIMN